MVTTSRGRRRARFAAAVVLGSVGATLWSACSVEEHYALLSTFFDGVPRPKSATTEESAPADRGGALARAPATILSGHSAYLERRCAECHGDRARFGFRTEGFAGVTGALCVTCHDVHDGDAFRHGPSAAGLCLTCHEAHVSTHEKLLVAPSPGLCLDCHGGALMHREPGAPHADPERDCMDCHRAHGGAGRFFLHADQPPEPSVAELAESPETPEPNP